MLGRTNAYSAQKDSGGEYLVKVVDYDGTVLKQDHLDAGATFTLPTAPTHSRLVFQEWSSPVTITSNTVTVADSDIIIGAIYTTASGVNEIDVSLTKVTGLTVTFDSTYASGLTFDWGDGTTDTNNTHTYVNYGVYTIKYATPSAQRNEILNASSRSMPIEAHFVGRNSFGQAACYGWTNLKSVTLSTSANRIFEGAFRGCGSLECIVLPTIPSISEYAFNSCISLKTVVTKSVVGIFLSAFHYCFNLKDIILPTTIQQYGTSVFHQCYGLERLYIPAVTALENGQFRYCQAMKTVVFNGDIGSIGNLCFSDCDCVMLYDFSKATAIPSLGANAFNGISAQCIIKVPDSLYSTWSTTTNWVDYADNIYRASEV